MNDTLSILVIEDDADTLANLGDILTLDGHEVVGVSTLADAKDAASQRSFGIVITDRKLPDGMIENLLPELKKWLDGAEVIVITGYADMQSTITAFRQGVTDYVIKPIIPEDLLSTVQRIARSKQLEEELAREHAFADLVLKTAEAIVLVLDLDGNVIQFNPYFRQLTGWTSDDLIGADWFAKCVNEQDRDWIREVFIRTAHDSDTRGIINAVMGRDGQEHQIRWSNTVLRDRNGDVTSVLAVGVDISDLSQAQQRALQAERLAAIGQTMTALAHESRNALQRIQAATEMLQLEVADNQNAQQDLMAIQRAGNDLKCLLEEVRSFAAPIHLKRSRTSIADVWRRVWDDLVALQSGRDATLSESLSAGDAFVEVDKLRMEQVFRNLFENALAACDDPVRIELTCCQDAESVTVIVRDNGPGMTDEQLQKLFEPFFTTKQSGTGLGLAICQRIVAAHGGVIEADSGGDGARFEIRLPLTKASEVKLRA